MSDKIRSSSGHVIVVDDYTPQSPTDWATKQYVDENGGGGTPGPAGSWGDTIRDREDSTGVRDQRDDGHDKSGFIPALQEF